MFGKSKARRYEPTEQQTTFEDIAGIEEASEELVQVVDFLKDPEKYRRAGRDHSPKGVLLAGPPVPARPCWRGAPGRRRSLSSAPAHRSSSR